VRRERVILPFVAAAGIGTAASCGSSSGSLAGGVPLEGGPLAEAGAGEGGEVGPPPGPTPLTDIADTPCTPAGGTRATVIAAGPNVPSFDALGAAGAAGARWAAQGSGDEGIVFFDVDGANAGAPVTVGPDANRMAGGGALVGVVGETAGAVTFARFDATGKPADAVPAAIANEKIHDLAVGRSGDMFAVLWAGASGVNVRAIDTNGGVGPAFQLGAAEELSFSGAVAAGASPGNFAVLWRGTAEPAHVTFVTTSATAVTLSKDVISGAAGALFNRVDQLVKTPTGYAALLETTDGTAWLVLIDSSGTYVRPHALRGTVAGYGLAAQGSELGVVAKRADGSIELRTFASNAAPYGDWRCLDGPPVDAGVSPRSAGIAADGAGYAVVYTAAGRAAILARVDRFGGP
jgi:hypothetical protein